MSSTSDAMPDRAEDVLSQPLRDRDATTTADPSTDPAQAEWERTDALDRGDDPEIATATGRDTAEIPDPDDQIPADDLPDSTEQPETQGTDPVIAELGDNGGGDLTPEDL